MDALPPQIAKLAVEAKFPSAKNDVVTLNKAQVGAISALLKALIGYLVIEYARCGQKTTPTPAPTN